MDAMDTGYNCNVEGKVYRLIYTLNKETIIKVKQELERLLKKSLDQMLGKEQ